MSFSHFFLFLLLSLGLANPLFTNPKFEKFYTSTKYKDCLDIASDFLRKRQPETLLEVGSSILSELQVTKDTTQTFTYLLSKYAFENNFHLYTVNQDLGSSLEKQKLLQDFSTNVEIIHSDEVNLLKRFRGSIDFLYIGELDLKNFPSYLYSIRLSNYINSIIDQLDDHSMVVINNKKSIREVLKNTALSNLLNNGWKIINVSFHTILVKDHNETL